MKVNEKDDARKKLTQKKKTLLERIQYGKYKIRWQEGSYNEHGGKNSDE